MGCPFCHEVWITLNNFYFVNDKYFLAVFNAKNKPDKKIIQGSGERKSDTDYKKMVYNLLPGPNKMLPKVFFSKKA